MKPSILPRQRPLFDSDPRTLLLGGLFIMSPLLEGGTTHLAVMIIRLGILLLLGISLVRAVQNDSIAYPRLAIGPAVACFLGLALISAITSPYLHQSVQWLIVLVSYAALLYLLASSLSGWHHITTLLVAIGAVGCFEAGWAVVQAVWVGRGRPSGTFFNPNFLAGYLAAIWTIGLGVVCYVLRGKRIGSLLATPRGRAGVVASAAVMALVLVAMLWTGSRGGTVALLGGTGVVLSLRYRWQALIVLLAVVLAGWLIPNPVRDRFTAEYIANPLGYARWHIWQSSIQAMLENPFGVGLGLYQYVYPRYMFPVEGQLMQYGRVARTAHNEYLQMGVELGVASLAIFGWGLIRIGQEVRQALGQRLRRWQRGILVGVTGGAVAILLQAVVDSNLHAPALALLLVACVGIIFSVRRCSGCHPELVRVIPVRSRWRWGTVGILVLGVLALEVGRLGGAWMTFEAGARAMAEQDFPRAIAHYERAAAWDSGKALYHSSLAAAQFRVFEQAANDKAAARVVEELETAISLNPTDGRLRGILARVYSAFASITPAADTPPAAGRAQRLAWLRSARAAYREALELEPYSPFYRLELARVSLALGNQRSAEALAQEAVELEPNFLPARAWLAHRYVTSARTKEAHREYEEILARRQRYANLPNNAVEERFLKVDLTALEAALKAGPART